MKTCVWCGAPLPKGRWMFCSRKCYIAYSRKMKVGYFKRHAFDKVVSNIKRHVKLDAKTVEFAKKLYFQNNIRGVDHNSAVSACVYLALKLNECKPVTMKTIVASLNFKDETKALKRVWKAYRKLISNSPNFQAKPCYVTPYIYVEDLCRKLGLSPRTRAYALRLAKKTVEKKLHIGKRPLVTAASIVYIAGLQCNEHVTQKEIAREAGVTEVGIRNVYHFIAKAFNMKLYNWEE